jgi:hypothetical protein
MKLTIAPENKQPVLLDVLPVWNCTDNATARNAYGSAAQEIICRVLKLDPIPINGNFDVCFDAKDKNTWYEIKSVRRNHKVVLFDFRLEKEANSGVPFKYAILVHNLRCARVDILSAMIASRPEIIVIEGAKVHEVHARFPLRRPESIHPDRHNPSYNGYTREGYNRGYRNVPVNELRKVGKVIPVDTLFL